MVEEWSSEEEGEGQMLYHKTVEPMYLQHHVIGSRALIASRLTVHQSDYLRGPGLLTLLCSRARSRDSRANAVADEQRIGLASYCLKEWGEVLKSYAEETVEGYGGRNKREYNLHPRKCMNIAKPSVHWNSTRLEELYQGHQCHVPRLTGGRLSHSEDISVKKAAEPRFEQPIHCCVGFHPPCLGTNLPSQPPFLQHGLQPPSGSNVPLIQEGSHAFGCPSLFTGRRFQYASLGGVFVGRSGFAFIRPLSLPVHCRIWRRRAEPSDPVTTFPASFRRVMWSPNWSPGPQLPFSLALPRSFAEMFLYDFVGSGIIVLQQQSKHKLTGIPYLLCIKWRNLACTGENMAAVNEFTTSLARSEYCLFPPFKPSNTITRWIYALDDVLHGKGTGLVSYPEAVSSSREGESQRDCMDIVWNATSQVICLETFTSGNANPAGLNTMVNGRMYDMSRPRRPHDAQRSRRKCATFSVNHMPPVAGEGGLMGGPRSAGVRKQSGEEIGWILFHVGAGGQAGSRSDDSQVTTDQRMLASRWKAAAAWRRQRGRVERRCLLNDQASDRANRSKSHPSDAWPQVEGFVSIVAFVARFGVTWRIRSRALALQHVIGGKNNACKFGSSKSCWWGTPTPSPHLGTMYVPHMYEYAFMAGRFTRYSCMRNCHEAARNWDTDCGEAMTRVPTYLRNSQGLDSNSDEAEKQFDVTWTLAPPPFIIDTHGSAAVPLTRYARDRHNRPILFLLWACPIPTLKILLVETFGARIPVMRTSCESWIHPPTFIPIRLGTDKGLQIVILHFTTNAWFSVSPSPSTEQFDDILLALLTSTFQEDDVLS
ncbi:hypothetical protein ACRALDRAFT_209716 [Sodiomyces alcalophilus JCM 7366]|uniref:uncharacterized protein n=1 Tax=Sodiomyces alcalophilus JCM 7366 TaxID=591952 RepID=UPI0039B56904